MLFKNGHTLPMRPSRGVAALSSEAASQVCREFYGGLLQVGQELLIVPASDPGGNGADTRSSRRVSDYGDEAGKHFPRKMTNSSKKKGAHIREKHGRNNHPLHFRIRRLQPALR